MFFILILEEFQVSHFRPSSESIMLHMLGAYYTRPHQGLKSNVANNGSISLEFLRALFMDPTIISFPSKKGNGGG